MNRRFLALHFRPSNRPTIHANMAAALRPGGVLVLEAFHPDQVAYSSGGPKDPAMLYAAEQLREDFAGTDILLLETSPRDLNEGEFHRGPAVTVRLVAVKR